MRAALMGFIQDCSVAITGNSLGSSQDARRVILDGDSTTDMAGGSINGGTGFIRGNPYKYTGTAATSTVSNYIIAAVDNTDLKMVQLQVCESKTKLVPSRSF